MQNIKNEAENELAQYYNIDKTMPQTVESLNIPKYAFIVLSAKRRAGKSVLARHLVKHICDVDNIDYVIVFSNTAKYNGDYDFLGKKFIYEYGEAENKIVKIMDYQKKKKLAKKDVPTGLLLFDDITIHKKNDKIIDLASYGRHINLYILLSTQYPKDCVGPSIRNNLDMIFFNDLNKNGIEAIYHAMHTNFKLDNLINFVEYCNDGQHAFICYDNNENDKHARIKLVKAQFLQSMEKCYKSKDEIAKLAEQKK